MFRTRRRVRKKVDVEEVRSVMRLQNCPTCRNTATCPKQGRFGGSAVGNEVAKLSYLQEHGDVSGKRNTARCPEQDRCGGSAVGNCHLQERTRRVVRNKIDVEGTVGNEVAKLSYLQEHGDVSGKRNTARCPEQDRCGGSAVGNLPEEHGEVSEQDRCGGSAVGN
ncbi:hypothetical protein J6590_098415 [Homalodisca vitripennis]|nr:hypothetical protein J6590_098415 [Homalodisca vitripennis]